MPKTFPTAQRLTTILPTLQTSKCTTPYELFKALSDNNYKSYKSKYSYRQIININYQ